MYFYLIDQWFYEEGREIIHLIHLLSLVRPSFLKFDRKHNFMEFISEFWGKIIKSKIGLENWEVKLKFWQLLSTFNKCNNITDLHYYEEWLHKVYEFTIYLLEKNSGEFPFSCIRYVITFWEQLTYKTISKSRSSINWSDTIMDVLK